MFTFILIFVGLFIPQTFFKPVNAQTVGTTYYVDCVDQNGSNPNDGLTQNSAWYTIVQANNAPLTPGDSLVFKRGCIWINTSTNPFLLIHWNGTSTEPIIISDYGEDVLPKPLIQGDANGSSQQRINISITGSYQIVENLRSTLINPNQDISCKLGETGINLGWYVGFNLASGAHHNTLQHIEADHLSVGVNFHDTASNNKVFYAYIHDLDALWRIDPVLKALGALGVNLHGDDNEVGFSTFERNWAECNYVDTNPPYNGQNQNYGSPFELYNANRAYVHHNKAYEHRKHFEMGSDATHTADSNVLAYNLFVSSRNDAKGPNIHGATNQFGPVTRTQLYNNTIVFTGSGSEALICACDGDPDLPENTTIIKNNIFIAETKAAFYSGEITESHNLYEDFKLTVDTTSDPFIQFVSGTSQSSISPTSIKLDTSDPQIFVNHSVPLGDFRLISTSPAVDVGGGIATNDPFLSAILSYDLDGADVPQGNVSDMGAYEYMLTNPSPTPVPSPMTEADFFLWASHFGEIVMSGTNGDFNGDTKVNVFDFALWVQNYVP